MGGVAGLVLIVGAGWLLFRRSRATNDNAGDQKQSDELPPQSKNWTPRSGTTRRLMAQDRR